MIYLKNNIEVVNHIHIPRTGGRYICELLYANNYILLSEKDIFYHGPNIIDGFEVIHFHKPLMKKYYSKFGLDSFTVVRDPLDRFISSSSNLFNFSKLIGMQDVFFSSKIFEILEKSQNIPCNWFRPQVEFIFEDTKIWKYERGLNFEFVEWLNEVVGLSISKMITEEYITHSYDNKVISINDLPTEMIKSIKKFYSQDYSLLEDI